MIVYFTVWTLLYINALNELNLETIDSSMIVILCIWTVYIGYLVNRLRSLDIEGGGTHFVKWGTCLIIGLIGEIIFIPLASSSMNNSSFGKLGSNWQITLFLECIPDVLISVVFFSSPYVFYRLE